MKWSLVFLMVASVCPLFADVIVEDGQVTRLKVERWKGTWAAPGGNYIERLHIKVNQFKVVNQTEEDKAILEAIENGEPFEIHLASRAATYFADTSDYKYFLKHHVPFTTRVFPKLKFNGVLKWHVTDNDEWNEESGEFESITEILLDDPNFKSKWGELNSNPRAPIVSQKIHLFDELYSK